MDKNLKIAIVGLGLIGGSIFKALCALNFDVYGVSKSEETIEKARGFSKNVSTSLETIKDCDIVFVATAINKTQSILDSLESIVSESVIVLDVASLKSFLCAKKRPYKFIPSHPMAGTEFSGFDNSFESLFKGAKWVLTPFEDTDSTDINRVSELIEIIGATPIIANPVEHDEAVALISHMPMLVAQALFKTASKNKLAMKLASSGFRDMTRLALSNVEMASDMVNYNSSNIQKALLELYTSVGELLSFDYNKQINEIKLNRQSMYKNDVNVF